MRHTLALMTTVPSWESRASTNCTLPQPSPTKSASTSSEATVTGLRMSNVMRATLRSSPIVDALYDSSEEGGGGTGVLELSSQGPAV